MNIDIQTKATIIKDFDSDLDILLRKLMSTKLDNQNIILDISHYLGLSSKKLNIFFEIAKNIKENNIKQDNMDIETTFNKLDNLNECNEYKTKNINNLEINDNINNSINNTNLKNTSNLDIYISKQFIIIKLIYII